MRDTTSFTEVYAVPGAAHIVDAIDPRTGLTYAYQSDEADVRRRHPDARRMTWAAWLASQVARQQTPITWTPTTQEQYRKMLEILPPAAWIFGGFLVGEPVDHCYQTGAARFRAFVHSNGAYMVADRPITIAEFRTFMEEKRYGR